jgi:hypothetical protein
VDVAATTYVSTACDPSITPDRHPEQEDDQAYAAEDHEDDDDRVSVDTVGGNVYREAEDRPYGYRNSDVPADEVLLLDWTVRSAEAETVRWLGAKGCSVGQVLSAIATRSD